MAIFFFIALSFPQRAFQQVPAKQRPSGGAVTSKRQTKANDTFPPVPLFKEIATEVGLTVSHISTEEKRYIVESMSG
ncbi:MAG: hypothetical protein M3N22_06640, partial [Acidobacteriota bacterium]|nr:hypothetical protein [Acidobacteriota bacterium]